MGTATLGFADGPSVRFRIDPSEVEWNFEINTSVQQTVGGRVIQITGATLSDIQVTGYFGEKRPGGTAASGEGHSGASWRLAESFATTVRRMMEHQALGSTRFGKKMNPPATFSYPPKGWRFAVYIKALGDPDGNGVVGHRPGKFSYRYLLVLFPVADRSGELAKAGSSQGVLDKKKQQAISQYFARISEGIGWRLSQYNQPVTNLSVTGE